MSFPTELFEDRLLPFFQCPVCLNFPNPETAYDHVTCGKVFCQKCVEDWCLKRQTCPTCGKTVDNSRLEFRRIKDLCKTVYQIMNFMHIRCPTTASTGSGKDRAALCPWANELSLLVSHLKVCDFVADDCKWGCKAHMPRKLLKEHERSECKMRMVQCEFCGLNEPLLKLEQHLAETCASCPDTLVPCRFKDCGCSVLCKRKDVASHENADGDVASDHFKLALKRVSALKETITLQEQTIAELRKESEPVWKPKTISAPEAEEAAPVVEAREQRKGATGERQGGFFVKCRNKHPLRNSPTQRLCDACGGKKRQMMVCTTCDFNICIDCAQTTVVKEKEPYLYTYCPACTEEEHVLMKNSFSKYTKTYKCESCKTEKMLENGRYYCAYCGFSVCNECQMRLSY